jgi:hypothetical protein
MTTIRSLMTGVLVLVTVSCNNTSNKTPVSEDGLNRKEASMNFDLKDVEPLLQQLTEKLQLFTNDDIQRLVKEIAAVPVEKEQRWQFNVKYAGSTAPLEVRAFMDDVEAPDLYFSTAPALADAIQTELNKFAEQRGR